MGGRRRKPDRSDGSEAARARRFARLYVSLVESLMREGVEEVIARVEARTVALEQLAAEDEIAQQPMYDPALGPCPTCGRG